MKEIGGYFELELNIGNEYHHDAKKINLGRSAFEYILRASRVSKIYIPYYTCDAIIESLEVTSTNYDFYSINEDLEPIFNYSILEGNEYFLYTNYFGLKDNYIIELARKMPNLIVDNAQAFFAKPIAGIDVFYSPRKFFGVPDGGYLYTNKILDRKLDIDISFNRFGHLIGRIEIGAEESYHKFKKNEKKLSRQPIMAMSKITQRILQNISYSTVAKIRIRNFAFLNEYLAKINQIKIKYENNIVPMAYPLFLPDNNIRKKLIENKIFVPFYWSNVIKWCAKDKFDYILAKGILPLPIDQRYDENDMKSIVKNLL